LVFVWRQGEYAHTTRTIDLETLIAYRASTGRTRWRADVPTAGPDFSIFVSRVDPTIL